MLRTPCLQILSFSPFTANPALPFIYQFASGAIAGVSEILVMYPLDVVKTRMQLQVKGTGEQYSSMVDCLQKIVRNEGFSRLYRGISAPILMEAPKRAVKFAANDEWGKFYRNAFGMPKMTQSLSILTGATAGATESFVVVPFELVKIRLQDKSSKYTGMADVVKTIVRQEGPLALYNGLEATLWRHITWNSGYFGVIFQVRQLLPKATDKRGQMINDLIAGSIGGTAGTVLNTPLMWSSPESRTPPESPVSSPSTTGPCPRCLPCSERRALALFTRDSCPRCCVWVLEEVFCWWCLPLAWISSEESTTVRNKRFVEANVRSTVADHLATLSRLDTLVIKERW